VKFSLAMRQGYALTTLEQAFDAWFSYNGMNYCMCPNMAIVRTVMPQEWGRVLEAFQDGFVHPQTHKVRNLLEDSDLEVTPFKVNEDALRPLIQENGGRMKAQHWDDSVEEILFRLSFCNGNHEIEAVADVMNFIIFLNDVSLLGWPHIASYLERHGN